MTRKADLVRSTGPGRLARCRLARTGERIALAQFGLESGNAHLKRLVLLARQLGHVLHRLEFLALDQIEIAQPAFSPGAEQRIELALDAGCDARGVIHQPRDFVEKAVAGLGHRSPRSTGSKSPRQWL